MATLRDQAARRRLDLSPITTSLTVNQQQYPSQTPVSALSSNSLSAPFGYHPATYTPVSAVRQYNPQQWGASPIPSDGSSHFPSRPESKLWPLLHPLIPHHEVNVLPPSRMRTFTRRPAPEAQRASPEISSSSRFVEHRPIPIVTETLPPPPPQEEINPQLLNTRPPASRRAASAGAVSTPSSSRSRNSSTSRWEPGMPLPPPPPGPPPQSRSQSMSRSTDRVVSPPTRRPGNMSSLGPVPPTPAGWVDEDVSRRGKSPNRGLTIDTTSVSSSQAAESNSGSSNSGLSRAKHVRGESKSIRERRSESKARKSATTVAEENSNNPWVEAITPADIIPPSTVLGRRPTIKRSTPRSGRFQGTSADTPTSADVSNLNTPGPGTESRGSTPRPLASSSRLDAPTPPFSPNQASISHSQSSPAIPPKALPTPPPQSRLPLESHAQPAHTRRMSNQDTAAVPPIDSHEITFSPVKYK
ncbi:hypothetical protein G7Y89_g126 [Cudoniella acicularis]|uniref:Uncharacterized protein n=1 Tax=Cudoniella acicularis TaxID=354080 RepID=A0A8H4W880_9HELO|nr:hypothetical protein G7Y89_g126 [Cudoniella acicularis]